MSTTTETRTAPPLSTRLETARLVLRPARSSDVSRVRQALRQNATHLRPWSAAPAPGEDPASLTSVSRTILRERGEWTSGQGFALLVFAREDEGVVVGRVAFGGVHRGAFQNAYVGYWIDQAQAGRGYVPEACVLLFRFAFEEIGLHRLQISIIPRNRPSRRVAQKLWLRGEGIALRYLEIDGRWEDHVRYAITAEEWLERRDRYSRQWLAGSASWLLAGSPVAAKRPPGPPSGLAG